MYNAYNVFRPVPGISYVFIKCYLLYLLSKTCTNKDKLV